MPRVTLRLGRESIREYMCDWPDCPDFAVEIVHAVVVHEQQILTVMCAEHAARYAKGKANPSVKEQG
jgi:hypothetical protein